MQQDSCQTLEIFYRAGFKILNRLEVREPVERFEVDAAHGRLLAISESKLKCFHLAPTVSERLVGLGSDGLGQNLRSIVPCGRSESALIVNEHFDFFRQNLQTGEISKMLRPFDGRYPLATANEAEPQTRYDFSGRKVTRAKERARGFFRPFLKSRHFGKSSMHFFPRHLLPNGEMIAVLRHDSLINEAPRNGPRFAESCYWSLVRMNIHATTQTGSSFQNAEVLQHVSGDVDEVQLYRKPSGDSRLNEYKVFMLIPAKGNNYVVDVLEYQTDPDHVLLARIQRKANTKPDTEYDVEHKDLSGGKHTMVLTMHQTIAPRPPENNFYTDLFAKRVYFYFLDESNLLDALAWDPDTGVVWVTFFRKNGRDWDTFLASRESLTDLGTGDYREREIDLGLRKTSTFTLGSLRVFAEAGRRWLLYQQNNAFALVDISAQPKVVLAQASSHKNYNVSFSARQRLLYLAQGSVLSVYHADTGKQVIKKEQPYQVDFLVVNEPRNTLTLYPRPHKRESRPAQEYFLDTFRESRSLVSRDALSGQKIVYYEPESQFDFCHLFQSQHLLLRPKPRFRYLPSYMVFPRSHFLSVIGHGYTAESLASFTDYMQLHVLDSSRQHGRVLGPLHPCMLAVFNNDPDSLSRLLDEHGFPHIACDLYMGIIEVAYRLARRECLSVLRRFLIEHGRENIGVSYRSFLTLLRSKSLEGHSAVASLFCSDDFEAIPTLRQQKSPVAIKLDSDVVSLVTAFNPSRSARLGLNEKAPTLRPKRATRSTTRSGSCRTRTCRSKWTSPSAAWTCSS